jgi:hypothetical protein
VLSFFCLFSCILAANVSPVSHSVPQPASGKAYYKVFPQHDIDTSKTSEFIKKTVGAEDLLPWTDVKDKLMYWTVEASVEKVIQLKSNDGIDRVDEFHPPAPPVVTRSTSEVDAATESPAKGQETTDRYLVVAVLNKSPAEHLQTQQALENPVGKENVRSSSGPNNDVTGWHRTRKIFPCFFFLNLHLLVGRLY